MCGLKWQTNIYTSHYYQLKSILIHNRRLSTVIQPLFSVTKILSSSASFFNTLLIIPTKREKRRQKLVASNIYWQKKSYAFLPLLEVIWLISCLDMHFHEHLMCQCRHNIICWTVQIYRLQIALHELKSYCSDNAH